MIAGKDILNRAHGALVLGRRVRVLAANLAQEIPKAASTARLSWQFDGDCFPMTMFCFI